MEIENFKSFFILSFHLFLWRSLGLDLAMMFHPKFFHTANTKLKKLTGKFLFKYDEIMRVSLHYAHLFASNIDKSIDFYREMFKA